MKTFLPKVDEIEHKWYLIDATDKVLGRLGTQIAELLSGKHKPDFTPFFDMGDYVIVINADKVKLTGSKENAKEYQRYSGYASGLKKTPYATMMETNPAHIIEHAVQGMLPKNKIRAKMLSRLKVFAGPEHPHVAQNPVKVS